MHFGIKTPWLRPSGLAVLFLFLKLTCFPFGGSMVSADSWRRVGLGSRSRPRPRPRLRTLSYLTLAIVILLWLVLPYDNTVRLAFRFNLMRLKATATSHSSESWVYSHPEYPVELGEDVLVILKTGYGTKERVPAWFDSLNDADEFKDIVVIADYASQPGSHFRYRGHEMPVHDMVKSSLGHKSLSAYKSHPRVLKYGELAEAVASGDDTLGRQLSRSFGWELDALKVRYPPIPSSSAGGRLTSR